MKQLGGLFLTHFIWDVLNFQDNKTNTGDFAVGTNYIWHEYLQ